MCVRLCACARVQRPSHRSHVCAFEMYTKSIRIMSKMTRPSARHSNALVLPLRARYKFWHFISCFAKFVGSANARRRHAPRCFCARSTCKNRCAWWWGCWRILSVRCGEMCGHYTRTHVRCIDIEFIVRSCVSALPTHVWPELQTRVERRRRLIIRRGVWIMDYCERTWINRSSASSCANKRTHLAHTLTHKLTHSVENDWRRKLILMALAWITIWDSLLDRLLPSIYCFFLIQKSNNLNQILFLEY